MEFKLKPYLNLPLRLYKPITNRKQDQTLKNIKAVLEAAGSSFEKILKLNVYIKDFGDFKAMNETYQTHFPGRKPVYPFLLRDHFGGGLTM